MHIGNTNRVQGSERHAPSFPFTTAHFKVAHNGTKGSLEAVQTDRLKTPLLSSETLKQQRAAFLTSKRWFRNQLEDPKLHSPTRQSRSCDKLKETEVMSSRLRPARHVVLATFFHVGTTSTAAVTVLLYNLKPNLNMSILFDIIVLTYEIHYNFH